MARERILKHCARMTETINLDGAPPPPGAYGDRVVWFALNDDRPLFALGGIWTEFSGDRGTKSKPIPGPHLGGTTACSET